MFANESFDIDKFVNDFNSIEENYATEEMIMLAKEISRLENEIAKLGNITFISSSNTDYGILYHIETIVRYKFKLGGRYGKLDMSKVPKELLNMSLDELWNLRERSIAKMKELDKELIEVKKRFHKLLGDEIYVYERTI